MPLEGCETPEIVLARTLEKAQAGMVEAVIVSILWKDTSISSDFSQISNSNAVYMLKGTDMDIEERMTRVYEEGDEELYPAG